MMNILRNGITANGSLISSISRQRDGQSAGMGCGGKRENIPASIRSEAGHGPPGKLDIRLVKTGHRDRLSELIEINPCGKSGR